MTALVTGANRGIGAALVEALRARADEVIATARSGNGFEPLDVSSAESCRALAERLHGKRIDLIIHNAGIGERQDLGSIDFESVKRQIDVNALGVLRVTQALLPNLERGAKIALVTSQMGSIGDNSSGGHYGYRMSKAAMNMAGVSLARDLAPRGIAVAILHPGYVRTRMTGGAGNVDAQESARNILARLDELTLENSGQFWRAAGGSLPW
jgi:NAD(P)-dependent dehydrogenase (short-subunit alcohol dehydrogenase family)